MSSAVASKGTQQSQGETRCSPPRLGAGVTLTITVKHHAILTDAVVTVAWLSPSRPRTRSPPLRPTHHDAMSLGVWLLFQLVARALTHIQASAMPPPIGLPIGEGRGSDGRGRRPADRGPLTIPSSRQAAAVAP